MIIKERPPFLELSALGNVVTNDICSLSFNPIGISHTSFHYLLPKSHDSSLCFKFLRVVPKWCGMV